MDAISIANFKFLQSFSFSRNDIPDGAISLIKTCMNGNNTVESINSRRLT